MGRILVRRLLTLVPVLVLVSIGTFLLVDLSPGDPAAAILGETGTTADYVRIRRELGLDKPVVERYVEWVKHVVRGDLGSNLIPPVERVSTRISRALPVNIELALLAILMAAVVALPLAVWAATRPGSVADRAISASALAVLSVPSFLAGLLLVWLLGIHLRWFPLGQWARPTEKGWMTNLHHAFLPALTLALAEAPVFTRLLRSDLVTTMQEDFILAARARGISGARLVLTHALRPSSFTSITLAGVSIGRLLGGTIIVEAVFGLPGLGKVITDAARARDLPLVQGGVLVIAVIYVLINVMVELSYAWLDPRTRRVRT